MVLSSSSISSPDSRRVTLAQALGLVPDTLARKKPSDESIASVLQKRFHARFYATSLSDTIGIVVNPFTTSANDPQDQPDPCVTEWAERVWTVLTATSRSQSVVLA